VIHAAEAVLLVSRQEERYASMGAELLEDADATRGVAERDQLLTE
jgi:hypothetical protein